MKISVQHKILNLASLSSYYSEDQVIQYYKEELSKKIGLVLLDKKILTIINDQQEDGLILTLELDLPDNINYKGIQL